MALNIGDKCTLDPEYERWYREYVPNGVYLFSPGDICEIMKFSTDSESGEQGYAVSAIRGESYGTGVGFVPARFVLPFVEASTEGL